MSKEGIGKSLRVAMAALALGGAPKAADAAQLTQDQLTMVTTTLNSKVLDYNKKTGKNLRLTPQSDRSMGITVDIEGDPRGTLRIQLPYSFLNAPDSLAAEELERLITFAKTAPTGMRGDGSGDYGFPKVK
jgi:hypothetical protein